MTYKFGKRPPKLDYRTLRFAKYLTPELPPPPPAYNVLDQVYANLPLAAHDTSMLFPLDGNGKYGCCTIAGIAHASTVYGGLVGNLDIPSEADVVKFYKCRTHGFDTGLNMLDVVRYWRKHKVFGDKILAFAALDLKTHKHDYVKTAIQLFGGVYLGFQVQADCQLDFNAGRPWTPGSLLNEGHAVYAVAYDAEGVTVLTWGSTQKGTWAWFDQTADEAYALLPPEAEMVNFTPGFDFAQLQSDLAAI